MRKGVAKHTKMSDIKPNTDKRALLLMIQLFAQLPHASVMTCELCTDYVESWVTAHADQIGGTLLKHGRDDQYGRILCMGFETASHIIGISAWDNASCLDILALFKASGETDYCVAGECDGVAGIEHRLNQFLIWAETSPHYSHARP
jgi:hypothetical protein